MRISDRCYAVTGLACIPPWSVNAGFVVGEQATLIVDTGANALAAATIHGYALAARPGNRLAVVDTEPHFDHIGGNGFFRAKGIEVYGHAGVRRTPAEFDAEIAEFNSAILNAARRERVEAKVFYAGTSLVNPTQALDADTRMDLGGCEVEILLTPGHTPANISVWVPDDGVLFSGDCLVNRYLPNLDCGGVDDWMAWLASIDRIARLAPKVVMPGHGPVAFGDDVTQIIDTMRKTLEHSVTVGRSPSAVAALTTETL
jgi:glyoxylase-like metal-dependent hydrolase (beta-lactamase superfamily II)